jgi:hypothetical protein
MKTPSVPALSAVLSTALLVSCIDPVPAPPPRFTPNGPYPPNQVDPYGNPSPDGKYPNIDPPEPSPPAPDPAPTRPGEYPVAKPTAKADEVVSPYEPYNIINVEGYRSGELVRDPHNKKIFRVP